MIVPFNFFTNGAIKSAFRYHLEPSSHVETLTQTLPGNLTPIAAYIFFKPSGVIYLVK